MGIENVPFDSDDWKIKNKKPLLVFILASFFLVLPVIVSSFLGTKYLTGMQKSILDYYLEFLFILVLLVFPVGFLIYGVYAFIKKEIFTGYGGSYSKFTGKLAQLLAILSIFIGLAGLVGLCYIFFFYGR